MSNSEPMIEPSSDVMQQPSKQLTSEFGKGFDASNLRNMRSFYLCFPKCDAVSHKLSWTHYRKLIRVENPKARAWYLPYLPTEAELKHELEQDRLKIQAQLMPGVDDK